jgi:hypothetical protein
MCRVWREHSLVIHVYSKSIALDNGVLLISLSLSLILVSFVDRLIFCIVVLFLLRDPRNISVVLCVVLMIDVVP